MTPGPQTTYRPSPAGTLDGFLERVSSADGVSLHDLDPLTTLVVRTPTN